MAWGRCCEHAYSKRLCCLSKAGAHTPSSPPPPHAQGTRPFTAVTLANVVSVVFAAPLAAGIMSMTAGRLKGWQLLFILEGIPSVLLGLIMLVSVML